MLNASTSATWRPDALAAVAAGYHVERDIIAQTGRTRPAALAQLQVHVDRGHIRRNWCGRYCITESGRQALLARFAAAARATAAGGFDPVTATIPELWEHLVAPHLLRGSSLVEQPSRSGAEEYLLNLGHSGRLLKDVVAQQPKIAALLHRPAEQVIIENDPGQATNRALLQMVGDDSPLYQVLEHPGTSAFDPETGNVTIGLYADGAPALWPLWDEHGARNGVIAGDAGSGTSVLLRGLLAAVDGSPLVTSYVVDIAGIGGLPATGRPIAVSDDAARLMLSELVDLLRQRLLAQVETGQPWSATPDTPLVLVALAELPRLVGSFGFGHPTTTLINTLQREGRKLGIAVIGEVKKVTASSFGRDDIRAGLLTGNLVHLRSSTRNYGLGLDMEPEQIPSQWHTGAPTCGVGYGRDRNAMLRVYYTPARMSVSADVVNSPAPTVLAGRS